MQVIAAENLFDVGAAMVCVKRFGLCENHIIRFLGLEKVLQFLLHSCEAHHIPGENFEVLNCGKPSVVRKCQSGIFRCCSCLEVVQRAELLLAKRILCFCMAAFMCAVGYPSEAHGAWQTM